MASLSSGFLKNQVYLMAVVMTVMYGYAAVRNFYFDEPIEVVLSFPASDLPVLPDSYTPKFVGKHTFGDYLLMNAINTGTNIANPTFFATPWPPATYLFFSPFRLMPYFLGLGLFLALSAVAMIWPVVYALRKSHWTPLESLVTVLATSVLTGPFVMTIDRGNTVAFLPLLIFGHLHFLSQRRTGISALALVIATIIKPHAILFLLISIHSKEWKLVFRVVLGALVVQVIGLLVSGDGFIAGIRGVLQAGTATSLDVPDFQSISIRSTIRQMGFELPFNLTVGNVVVSGVLLVWMIGVTFCLSRNRQILRYALIFGAYPLLIPASPAYNSTVMIALFAIMIQFVLETEKDKENTDHRRSELLNDYLLSGLLVFSQLVPIPITWTQLGSVQRPFAGTVYLLVLGYVTVQTLVPRVSQAGSLMSRRFVLALFIPLLGIPLNSRLVTIAEHRVKSSEVIPHSISESLCSTNYVRGRFVKVSISKPKTSMRSGVVKVIMGTGKYSSTLQLSDNWGFVEFRDTRGVSRSSWLRTGNNHDQTSLTVQIENDHGLTVSTGGGSIVNLPMAPALQCTLVRVIEESELSNQDGFVVDFGVYQRFGMFWYNGTIRFFPWIGLVLAMIGIYLLALGATQRKLSVKSLSEGSSV